MERSKGALASIIFASILFGSMGVLVRLISVQVPAFAQVLIRVLFATFVITAIALSQNRKDLLSVKRRELAYYAISGVFGYGLMLILFTLSVLGTTIGNTYFLLYTQPIFVAILAYFLLREKGSRRLTAAILLSFLGILAIFNPLAGGLVMGDAYGLGAGFLYAVYIVIGRYMRGRHTTYTNTAWTFIFALIFLIPATLLVQSPFGLVISGYTWFLLMLFSAINVLAYLLLNYGLKNLKAAYTGILLLLEPVSSVFFAFGFFGEFLSYNQLLGSLLIVASIVYLTWVDGKK